MTIQAKDLAEIFLTGDDEKALEIVLGYLENHSHDELYHDLLTPAMYLIGDWWQENRISVADEHLATAICDFVVSAAELKRKPKNGIQRKAMVLGPEGEDHYIGLKMVSSLFKEHGWEVQYMGPNLPLEPAIESALRFRPDVIAMSAALAYRLPALKAYSEAFRALEFNPTILIGGRAVSTADISKMRSEGILVVKDLLQLKEWLQTGKEAEHEFN
ncbi:cobalamin B12-binding domain-containing protein [Planococcus beigongshangi]|uniref:cobalamin B12-binding domain-containing protein n=1 Tax=Planococcus beigongshangi TaxID=2782536 RepID=UPI00193B0B4A|nr:cobalamin-dependent protein [Planococcus beigongshangi]